MVASASLVKGHFQLDDRFEAFAIIMNARLEMFSLICRDMQKLPNFACESAMGVHPSVPLKKRMNLLGR